MGFDPRRGAAVRLAIDLGCWVGALLAALAIRYGFDPGWREVRSTLLFAPVLLVLQALIGEFAGVYRRLRLDSLDELVALAGAVLLATGVATAFNALLETQAVPHSVPLAGGALALAAMVTVRAVRRLVAEEREPWDDDIA